MLVILLVLFWLLLLYLAWPMLIRWAIRRHTGWGEQIGSYFMLVPLIALVTFYITLVLSGNKEVGVWWDTEPAVTAILITVGIFFTAINLFPLSFYAAYSDVIDFKTGRYADNRVGILNIEKGKWHPVYLAIHNTSTFTWDNYRVTISLPDGFDASERVKEFPGSEKWNYAPKRGSLTIGQNPCYVQKSSSSVLTIGETSATRFFIKSNNIGEFKMKIMMTSARRIGERRQLLRLHVKEESHA